MKYVAVARVSWMLDANCSKDDYFAISEVENFTEAMHRIEEAYGEDMEDVEIFLLDSLFYPLDKETFQNIRAECVISPGKEIVNE